MQRSVVTENEEDLRDKQILENVTNWQSSDNPLAPLSEEQMDLVYEIGDKISLLYCKNEDEEKIQPAATESITKDHIPIIYKNEDFIDWLISVEQDIKHENLKNFQDYHEQLLKHKENCVRLFTYSDSTLSSLNDLKGEYNNVTEKTNYLHDLSEQLMTQQRLLKEKKASLNERLKFFTYFSKCQEGIERLGNKINSTEFIEYLVNIDEAIVYLNDHMNFKESRVYKMKYESLLSITLHKIYNYINNIITETTKQVINPEFKTHLLPQAAVTDSAGDSTFSLYYGKFQSAASKIKLILNHLEEKDDNEQYLNTLTDCQKTYLTQRLPVLSDAVSKALNELKEKHKSDYSILFRSCTLFTMKVCQDEARCFSYFFNKTSTHLDEYLGTLCQYLYDALRPCLILINHIEILAELCGILKSEACSDKVLSDYQLYKYVETVKQLLEDVEERLVFRTNVFFQHDLNGYKPSPGDLAYPEKLEQMENIALDFRERRPDSRASSVVSLESQEVAHINNAHQVTQFRSYTGNSPADLHGMWYPTVKRTLVCLSRLYFCLDRSTFQGLAQEALIVCVNTVQAASDLISAKKTPIDGRLFQIKHLLIIREQIAPFQVDFTAKEVGLDFSTVHKAAVDLINHRNNIFVFGTNNALLEFLLEGTPKVKEYLVDSRKEIDKQLKHSCEEFISHVTKVLIGNILEWIEKAEHILKIIQAEGQKSNDLSVASQDFGKPNVLAGVVKDARKNMKQRIPEVQRSMQLYLANRETEFILFRPVKNNIINAFIKVDEILGKGGYTHEDQLQVACPSPEQVNIFICSVSLTGEQEQVKNV